MPDLFDEIAPSKGDVFDQIKPEPSEPPPFVPSPDIISGEQAEHEGISDYNAPTFFQRGIVSPETALKAMTVTTPLVRLAQKTKFGEDFYKRAAEIGSGLTSPEGLGIAALALVAPEAAIPMGLGFGAQSTVEGASEIARGEYGAGAADLLAGVGLLAGTGKHMSSIRRADIPPTVGAKPEFEPTRESTLREGLSALEESGAGGTEAAAALRRQVRDLVAEERAGVSPRTEARGEVPIIGETKVPLKTESQIEAELRGELPPSEVVVPSGPVGTPIERPGAGPPTGGQISFAAPAAAEAIPSARQAALPQTRLALIREDLSRAFEESLKREDEVARPAEPAAKTEVIPPEKAKEETPQEEVLAQPEAVPERVMHSWRSKSTGQILEGKPEETHVDVLKRFGITKTTFGDFELGFTDTRGKFITEREFDYGPKGKWESLTQPSGRKSDLALDQPTAAPETVQAKAADIAKPWEWKKVASVTPGGKPHFWNRIDPEGHVTWSVVWNRQSKKWEVYDPQNKPVDTFPTEALAKSYVSERTPRPHEDIGAGPGSPSAREMEAKVKLPAQVNAEKLQKQFELFDQEIGDALTTGGQFLTKELRPEVAKGKPAEKGTVTSKQINQYFVSKLSTLMQELKRVRLEVQRTADIDTQRYFRLIEDRAKNAFRQVQELRRTSHESLYFWNQIRAEYQDIARAIGQAPEMKQFKPVIDQLVKDARQGDWEAFRRHLVEYPRVNLFTLGSWTLDFGTNLLATATKLPTWSVLDLGSFVSGKPAVRISSFLRALALSGKNVIPGIEKFRLPPEIETRLGTTAGGELAGYGKEILVDFSEILRNHPNAAQKLKEVDRLLSAPARMKRAVDNFFGRLGAATELRVAAFEEARKLGLKGDEQAAFVENFIQAPDTVSMERAVKAGKELKFNRDLSAWEEQISQSIGVKLFAETYPRWTFQFMRWASEMVGINPSLWKRMAKGEAKASEVTDYFVKAATGWGGIWAFNQLFYKNVDPNTMEYVREDGNRTRLSGRTPMPELYFINALLRGDTSNAKAALAHLSIPGARMLGGEPGGLLSPIIQTMSESIKGRYTAERTATELEKIANDAIPGKSVLGFIRALYDPSVREGFGAPIPGVSETLPQRVNPTTGEPLSPAQRIPGTGIKLPTVGGTPFPGGVRVLNQVEQALLDHGLGLARPRRTSLIELPAEDVPKNVRREYEQVAGRRVNEFIMEGINDPDFAAQPFEVRRKLLQHWLSAARRTARSELAEKYGFSAKPVESLPLPVERLPESLKGEYRRAK